MIDLHLFLISKKFIFWTIINWLYLGFFLLWIVLWTTGIISILSYMVLLFAFPWKLADWIGEFQQMFEPNKSVLFTKVWCKNLSKPECASDISRWKDTENPKKGFRWCSDCLWFCLVLWPKKILSYWNSACFTSVAKKFKWSKIPLQKRLLLIPCENLFGRDMKIISTIINFSFIKSLSKFVHLKASFHFSYFDSFLGIR